MLGCWNLSLKAPITTAADDIQKYFFHCFSEKIRLDVTSDSSARQRIHKENSALFSSKDKSEKLKCHLLQFLFGALKVNHIALRTAKTLWSFGCFECNKPYCTQNGQNSLEFWLF